MQTNVVLLSFEESSKAYQALSELKQAAVQGKIGLNTVAEFQGAIKIALYHSGGVEADFALHGSLFQFAQGLIGFAAFFKRQ